ncbi:solute carrier family 2 member 9, like 1 [Solea solea]|uniref:solute carrier family 2 member 9, like 1 n=1 Tax=Solea solea TaxID=90069 RepID=UPI00272BDBA0|nr:solute carrier family 2 member 9, like 1 [Solea solea]
MGSVLQQLCRGKALLVIITLGFGGTFHLGYHMTALSSPSPFIQSFINSSWFDRYGEAPPPQTVTMIWSLIVSMFAVGGLFGAGSVKIVSGRLGRKKAMMLSCCVSLVAMVIMLSSKKAKSYEMVIVARILYGWSTGVGNSIHVIYLSEISPRKIRGIVTLTSATFASLGKLSGQFLGLSEILGRKELWNVLLAVPGVFAAVALITLPLLPEAPRYLLIEKRDDETCKKALQSLWGKGVYKEEMDDMLAEQAVIEAAPPKTPLQLLRDRMVRWQLVTMVLIYGCNQLSGMSVISTFAFDIFLQVGIQEGQIRYITLGLGIVEILTSIASGLLLIEQLGRRPLIWGGYVIMSSCWVLVTITLNLQNQSEWIPYVTASLIVLFIIVFSGGPVGAIAALNSELFIQTDRVAALVVIGVQRWLTFATVGLVFPFILTSLGSYSFLVFAVMSLVGCLYTFFFLPETKGKTILEISEQFRAITICGKSLAEKKDIETKL